MMKNMFSPIFKLFKREPVIYPKKGELWKIRNTSKDPWGGEQYPPIKILDVKEGWVRYTMGANSLFSDERKPMKSFLYIYEKYMPS